MKLIPIGLALQVPRSKTSWLPVSIYALVDPRNDCIMYVGKTKLTIQARLKWHLREPTNAAMSAWFAELKATKYRKPQVHLLEKVTAEEWEDAERGWIHWCKQRGDLLNIDPGGNYRILGVPRAITFGEFQEPVAAPAPTPKKRPRFPWHEIKAENAARVEREKAEAGKRVKIDSSGVWKRERHA